MQSDLKPCPFCGGAPHIMHCVAATYMIQCLQCKATTDDGSIDRISANWNRREPALSDKSAGEVKAPEGWELVPKSAIMWLIGAGPDAYGNWFDKPEGAPAFWWRTHFNKLRADAAKLRSALVDVPAVEPAIPTANCCVCGRIIDTREKSEGGDDFGDETEAGKWTCSVQCYDAYVGFVPDEPEPLREGEDSAEVERICTEAAMRQWANSTKRPDLAEKDRVLGAIEAYKRQALAFALAATRSASATSPIGIDDSCPGEHQEVLDAIQSHNSGEDE